MWWIYSCKNQNRRIINVQLNQYIEYRESKLNLKLDLDLYDEYNQLIEDIIYSKNNYGDILLRRNIQYTLIKNEPLWKIDDGNEILSFDKFTELYEHVNKTQLYPRAKMILYDCRNGFTSTCKSWNANKTLGNSNNPKSNKIRALVTIEASAITLEETFPTIHLVLMKSTCSEITEGIKFETQWLCCFCSKEEKSLTAVITHALMNCEEVERHTNLKSTHAFLCLICGSRHSQSKNLRKHVTIQHGETTSFFPCLACKRHFYVLEDYKKHLNTFHNGTWRESEDLQFKCKDCDKVFSSRSKINRHIRSVHCINRLYSCSLCDKSFKEKEKLTRHEKIHNDSTKNIPCHLCDKNFRTISNLKQHLMFHQIRGMKENEKHDVSKKIIDTQSQAEDSKSIPIPNEIDQSQLSSTESEIVEVNGSTYQIRYPDINELTTDEKKILDDKTRQSNDDPTMIKIMPLFITELPCDED